MGDCYSQLCKVHMENYVQSSAIYVLHVVIYGLGKRI